MKPVTKILKKYIALSILLFSASVFSQEAPFSQDKILEIQDRVNSMSVFQLNDRKAQLLLETEELEKEQSTSQSPARLKSIANRLNEVFVELNMIQKAFVLIGGAGILGSLADDDSRDTTAPIVTVTSGTDTVELGGTWTDAGATATDLSGTVTVVTTGTVDTDTVGTYTITYSATDAYDNTGTATRTVTVVDTTAPIVTVTSGTDTVELGGTWTDAGATADGGETVKTTGTVDTDTVGTYTITYSATDASENTGTATRTVTVEDTAGPEFTSLATFSAAENQTAIGTVTANDPAGTVTFIVSGSELAITTSGVLTFTSEPDYETKKTYTATVTASDGTNTNTQVITVSVLDDNDNRPVITSPDTFVVDENQLSVGTVTFTDADAGSDDPDWRGFFIRSGADRDSFNIGFKTGVITFKEAPDFETKSLFNSQTKSSNY